MKGYLDADEETQKAIDEEGWLHTGDIGTMDERGYIKITDRLKDMFIVGGFNAYPAEIENTLLQMPGVGEVAVIGVPGCAPRGSGDGVRGSLRQGSRSTPDAVIAWSRGEHGELQGTSGASRCSTPSHATRLGRS